MKDCLGSELKRQGEQGFMLVGLIVAIFIILLALSVAAPKMAQELRREREVETIHRGDQYVRAIRVFYRKNGGMFPGSIEQLEKTNNVRYLRQRYLDPMTGKDDWRLIHVGEAKTTVKGFFGQPLSGVAPGLGAAAGSISQGQGTTPGSSPTGTSGFGSSSFGSSSFGSSSGSSAFGSSGSSGMPTLGGNSSTSGTSTPGSSSGAPNTLGSVSDIASSQSGTGMPGGGGPFVGVGLRKEGDSITILNEQTTYNTWEFLYDPRIEQLYAKGALLGGGATGAGTTGGSSSGFGGTTTPSSGFGSSPSSGFGSSPSSGFGSSPSSGFGSSPTTPTTPPQQPQ